MSENIIEVRGLAFGYPGRPILKGIDLDIPRGKVVAILGASGSGKTTLLQLIGGALKPAAGTVRVCDQVVHDLDDAALYALRRRMGSSATCRCSTTSRSRSASILGFPRRWCATSS